VLPGATWWAVVVGIKRVWVDWRVGLREVLAGNQDGMESVVKASARADEQAIRLVSTGDGAYGLD